MFNLIVLTQNISDISEYKCYTFSIVENCIDCINICKNKAIENRNYSISFRFNHCCIDDITIQPYILLSYDICINKIFINSSCNELLGLTLTEDLTTEILNDLFEKNNFSINDYVMW